MKKFAIILLVCLLAICAFAADKSVTINTKTTLNGQTLTPGEYKVSYEIKGPTANVKLSHAGKTVATATGQVVEQKDPSVYTGIVNQTNADGSQNIIEIQIANQKSVIRFNADNTAAGK